MSEIDETEGNDPASEDAAQGAGEEPVVYALSRKQGGWRLSRRDFIAATAAALGGLVAGVPGQGRAAAEDAAPDEQWRAHVDEVTALAVTSDGDYLLSGGGKFDRHLKMWKLPEGAHYATLHAHAGVNALAAGPEARAVTACADGWIRPYELPTRGLPHPYRHGRWARDVEVSQDEKHFASCGGFEIVVGDLTTLQGTYKLTLENCATCLTFVGNESHLIVGDNSGQLHVYSVETGQRLTLEDVHDHAITALSYNKNRSLLGVASIDGTVSIWQIDPTQIADQTGGLSEVVRLTEDHLGGADVTALAWAETHGLLATANDRGEVQLWSTTDWHMRATLGGHILPVKAVAVAGKHNLLASGDTDGRIMLWELPSGVPLVCLLDLSCVTDRYSGTTYEVEVAGQLVTCTLPSGSPLPPDAVCTCDSVSGTYCPTDVACTCDSVCYTHSICRRHVACSCVGHVRSITRCALHGPCRVACSCVGHVSRPQSGGSSGSTTITYYYYYPN